MKKVGLDAGDQKSFRPVSNLQFLSKLLERVVQARLQAFLESNRLMPTRDVNTRDPGYLDTHYPGPMWATPGPVKPAICPVTAIAFIKALTARVAICMRVLHWLQQKTQSGPCVNSLLIIIAHAAH